VFFRDPDGGWHTLRWTGLPPDGEPPAFGDARREQLLRPVRQAGLAPKSDAELLPVLLELVGARPGQSVARPAKAKVLDQDLAGGDCWLCRVAGHWAWFCVIGGHPDTPTWLAGCPPAGGDGRLAVVMPYAGSCGGRDSVRVVQRG
jgi:hypothetical protein